MPAWFSGSRHATHLWTICVPKHVFHISLYDVLLEMAGRVKGNVFSFEERLDIQWNRLPDRFLAGGILCCLQLTETFENLKKGNSVHINRTLCCFKLGIRSNEKCCRRNHRSECHPFHDPCTNSDRREEWQIVVYKHGSKWIQICTAFERNVIH